MGVVVMLDPEPPLPAPAPPGGHVAGGEDRLGGGLAVLSHHHPGVGLQAGLPSQIGVGLSADADEGQVARQRAAAAQQHLLNPRTPQEAGDGFPQEQLHARLAVEIGAEAAEERAERGDQRLSRLHHGDPAAAPPGRHRELRPEEPAAHDHHLGSRLQLLAQGVGVGDGPVGGDPGQGGPGDSQGPGPRTGRQQQAVESERLAVRQLELALPQVDGRNRPEGVPLDRLL